MDFDHARDCATRALNSHRNASINALVWLTELKRGGQRKSVESQAVRMFTTLGKVASEAEATITGELRDTIGLAVAKAGKAKLLKVGGLRFTTGHEAAAVLIARVAGYAAQCKADPIDGLEFLARSRASWEKLLGRVQLEWELVRTAGTVTTPPASTVPAEFRDGGKPDGEPLTAPYLEENGDWLLKSAELTRAFKRKKVLTKRVKVGRSFAYPYRELLVLRDQKTRREDGRR